MTNRYVIPTFNVSKIIVNALKIYIYIPFTRVTFPFKRASCASCACFVGSCIVQRGIRVRASFFVYRANFLRSTVLYFDRMIKIAPMVDQLYGIL